MKGKVTWHLLAAHWETKTEMLLLYARARLYEATQKLREAIAQEEYLASLLRREK